MQDGIHKETSYSGEQKHYYKDRGRGHFIYFYKPPPAPIDLLPQSYSIKPFVFHKEAHTSYHGQSGAHIALGKPRHIPNSQLEDLENSSISATAL